MIKEGETIDYKKSLQTIKRTLRIQTNEAGAFFYLGLAYTELDCWPKAIEAFKEAIRQKPDYAGAHFSLGICDLACKNLAEAVDEYQALKPLDEKLAVALSYFIFTQVQEQRPNRFKRLKRVSGESKPTKDLGSKTDRSSDPPGGHQDTAA